MSFQPTIVERDEQPYVAIRMTVTMGTIETVGHRLPEIFAWLAARGIAPGGAPFFRYNVIDMERELEVEAGVPVAVPAASDGEVFSGLLPAGRYVSATHVGHPDELAAVTGQLLAWADEQGLTWDRTDTPAGQRWGCRLEVYETNPAEEPDMSKWETELLFRLAGAPLTG